MTNTTNKTTYNELVCSLQEKAAGHNEKISIFIYNTEKSEKTVILNNTKKRYNCAYIFYDPVNKKTPLDYSPINEEAVYYCVTLKELEEIVEYLLNQSSVWLIDIDPEDYLEVENYGEDSLDL